MNIADELEQTDAWRVKAAAVLDQNAPREEVEKAFADQAYVNIQNKARPLMKPPYQLGFETVYANEDNTRMVGIFVFRCKQQHLYCPVFFINGQIKGTDLLYRVEQKQFVPNTPEWIDYLMNLIPNDEGEGVPKDEIRPSQALDLESIASPYALAGSGGIHMLGFGKTASADWEDCSQAFADVRKEIAEPGSLLGRFVAQNVGGEALVKVAAANIQSHQFAEAFANSYDLDELAQAVAAFDRENAKTASAEPQDLLVLHVNPLQGGVKAASFEQGKSAIKKGYSYDDNRQDDEINAAIFETEPREVCSLNQPGCFDGIMLDGSSKKVLITAQKDLPCNYDYPRDDSENDNPVHVFELKGKKARWCGQLNQSARAYGHRDEDFKLDDLITDKPSKDKCYSLINRESMLCTRPFYVSKVSTKKDGCCEVEYHEWSFIGAGDRASCLFVNPDKTGLGSRENSILVGGDYAFLPVEAKVKSEGGESDSLVGSSSEDANGERSRKSVRVDYGEKMLPFASGAEITESAIDKGFKKASVTRQYDEGADQVSYSVDFGNETLALLENPKIAAVTHLMARCSLREDTVDGIMERVDKDGRFDFYYDAKKASVLMPRFPEFPKQYSSELGVEVQPYDAAILTGQNQPQQVPTVRFGDAMELGTNAETRPSLPPDQPAMMETAAPEELYEMAQATGLNSLFDHGVVGSLVRTFDSMQMLEQWMPDLEAALDRLGRILFLIYWKPEDFRQAFGSDDVSTMENKILSSFKAYGDLVLDLLRKNKDAAQGTASLK